MASRGCYGVLTDVQSYFSIDDTKIGLLQTVFIICYMLSALISGFLGDRYNRKWLMNAGITCWILSIFISSFIPSKYYYIFLSLRGVLGIGQACFSTIAPTLIADMFVKSMRARALMVFFFAAPLGSGFGYMFGSWCNSLLNDWIWGLRLTPVFGVLCVILITMIVREPLRGEAEIATGAQTASHIEPTSYCNDILSLLRIPTYVMASIAYTAVVFVMVSLSWWAPTAICYAFAINHNLTSTELISNTDKTKINAIFGLITITSGVFGVIIGSVWAQIFICLTNTTMCFNFAINVELYMNVVIPTRRSVANACQIFISNLFGGAVGPYVVGKVSDAIRGDKIDPVARFNAVLTPFYLLICILLLSGVLFVAAAIFFKLDHQKFRDQMGNNAMSFSHVLFFACFIQN
ncbi:unnamed protein product [Anisakis simplex]|uniref:MFS domain-containing protein n=1 Tax=Anisakis simplex TaxID=6269 RepID=A0A0M3JYB7_ANISI|nr:unnamed protein product [Anisakis simplex]